MDAYLDHAASTPLRPEALAAVTSVSAEVCGNPTGAHGPARRARRVVDEARDAVAALCGVEAGAVVFTSGGTEADDLAVNGVLDAVAERTGGHDHVAVCSAVEHPAVLEPVLHRGGHTVRVDHNGRVDLDHLDAVLIEHGDRVAVVSVMAANNEVGVVQPLEDVARIVRRRAPDAVLHTDAVQAAAWVDLAPIVASVDLLSVSAHKIGGPKGAGALIVGSGVAVAPRLRGGGQERGRRSGTHNVAGIAGFGAAAQATLAARADTAARVAALRERLAAAVTATVPAATVTVPAEVPQLPSILHLCIEGADSEVLLFLLDDAGVAASAASSCSSGALAGSHVLAAMGVAPERAAGALRLSLGWPSTEAEVDHAATVLRAAVERTAAFGAAAS